MFGRRLKLSNGRRLVCDVVRLAQKIPAYGLIRDIDISAIDELRRRISPRLSWTVIMMKAYARVATYTPQLRQHYVSFPWGHIYQHHCSIATMVINREHEGEERLFFARFHAPETFSLTELQERYDHFRTAPIAQVKQFQHQISFARAPALLRRIGWWIMINAWPIKGPKHLGTFGVAVSKFRDIHGTQHLSPAPSTIGVDLVSRGGISHTVGTFDHRIFDAWLAGKVLVDLSRELNGPIRDELQQMADGQAAAREPASERSVA